VNQVLDGDPVAKSEGASEARSIEQEWQQSFDLGLESLGIPIFEILGLKQYAKAQAQKLSLNQILHNDNTNMQFEESQQQINE